MQTLALKLFGDMPADEIAGWAAIFSALAVVGVIWIGHNMYKLARNQVKLAMMVEEILKRR
jgi:hypothetical protein